jgi:hypothetical protein
MRLQIKHEEILWLAKYSLKKLWAEIKVNILGENVVMRSQLSNIKPKTY